MLQDRRRAKDAARPEGITNSEFVPQGGVIRWIDRVPCEQGAAR
jgi:hypothetical protein